MLSENLKSCGQDLMKLEDVSKMVKKWLLLVLPVLLLGKQSRVLPIIFFFYFWHVKPAYEVSATEFYTLHYKYFTSYLTRGIKMVAFTSYNFSRKSIHLNYTKNSFSHVKIQLFKVLQSCWYLMTGRILAVQPSPKTWTIWGPELFLRI